ncbi:hypothetical protein JD844_017222 [Phrynosoma platyrhinos]|uniref:Flavin-containing monooxygenase n=1 Tax=Phrynosoma platyrhinos TaxID=52577 RepID=A0ABQ7SLN4_PHRPL|nr:hypothetical protein JD844_017222 [Phrynosoma platyrhinos]
MLQKETLLTKGEQETRNPKRCQDQMVVNNLEGPNDNPKAKSPNHNGASEIQNESPNGEGPPGPYQTDGASKSLTWTESERETKSLTQTPWGPGAHIENRRDSQIASKDCTYQERLDPEGAGPELEADSMVAKLPMKILQVEDKGIQLNRKSRELSPQSLSQGQENTMPQDNSKFYRGIHQEPQQQGVVLSAHQDSQRKENCPGACSGREKPRIIQTPEVPVPKFLSLESPEFPPKLQCPAVLLGSEDQAAEAEKITIRSPDDLSASTTPTFQASTRSWSNQKLITVEGAFKEMSSQSEEEKLITPFPSEGSSKSHSGGGKDFEGFGTSRSQSIQTDFIEYLDELAVESGSKPDLFSLLVTDPKLAMTIFFGPCSPYQFRLMGPGKWSGARNAILTQEERIIKPTKTRVVGNSASYNQFFLLKIISIIVLLAAVFLISTQ